MVFRDGASLNLIFDADDTLWDSNIHFLEAFEQFVEAATRLHQRLDRAAVKSLFHEIELELIGTHGYGRGPYLIALERAAHRIASDDTRAELRAKAREIGTRLIERHCELLPGVEDTLRELSRRHVLMLFTKGARAEQLRKLDRSGLAPLFSLVETPREKDVEAYRRLIAQAQLGTERTFMIGNSPRSDINPALRAGLRAVYIPYPHTWELEHEELIPAEGRFVELGSFRDLLEMF